MDRRKFIKAGCISCVSVSLLSTLVQSCKSVKYVSGNMEANGISVSLKDFETKNGQRPYVIVQHPDMQYPICVYNTGNNNYSALLMRCTHQGAELQVSGDQLTCPAHGSAFDKYGKVLQSPAAENLRTFPVSVAEQSLLIDLRKKS
ncbi:MAG: Rieske (2Fe-2S) protein [Flavipsychrobacter sp.]|jgi:Rieske Fe-S protein|nr:Rieske (2Fe-2S) protein [Flavipsychrobacter sp.]